MKRLVLFLFLVLVSSTALAGDSLVLGRLVSGVIARTTTPFVLDGPGEGAVRTPVFSYALPDNTLGLNREVCVSLSALYQNTGTPGQITAFITFGGVTLWADADTSIANTVTRPLRLNFCITNGTATNAQIASGFISLALYNTAATTGQGPWSAGGNEQLASLRGATAIDTAAGGSDTLTIDFQLPNAEATCILTVERVVVALL